MRQKRFQDSASKSQGLFDGLVGIGDTGHVKGLVLQLVGVFLGQFDGVGLGLDPLSPIAFGTSVLGQKHGVAIAAAKGATHKGIACEVESAPKDETGGITEDGFGNDGFHVLILASGGGFAQNTSLAMIFSNWE